MNARADDVWCEVEVQKGALVSVYRGRIDGDEFARWKNGELGKDGKGILALHDAYWSYDEGDGVEGWVVVGTSPGPYAAGTGTIYVRADSILVVVALRDGSEREAHKLRPRSAWPDA